MNETARGGQAGKGERLADWADGRLGVYALAKASPRAPRAGAAAHRGAAAGQALPAGAGPARAGDVRPGTRIEKTTVAEYRELTSGDHHH
ncbi:hypothetical protein ABZT06_26600 [Streptomyces sp. NPDC005483]|uniref:hypothetical protein n=1 Tax=Streptomyces sp. NPDC005483 TaxID=3154882 RepID=UPI0033BA768F